MTLDPAGEQPAGWRWLGRISFAAAVREQERLRDAVIRGDGPESLLLCEHDPVVTLGRSANPANVLLSAAELHTRGVDIHAASRGGDVTYHGPGQLVGYPIVRLRGGVLGHLTAMARALSAVLGELDIDARWRREAPGLWVGGAKICAFGVHVRRRVTMHGFALNVSGALGGFQMIVPCGLNGVATTSIARERVAPVPSLHVLAARVARALGPELGIEFVPEIESSKWITRMIAA
jgi:lipoyl(octanoyl) transferase